MLMLGKKKLGKLRSNNWERRLTTFFFCCKVRSIQWIDHIFEKDGKYYIVESKFGCSTLGSTKDWKQMSKWWIFWSNRLLNAVWENEDLFDEISLSYISLLATVSKNGNIKYTLLDDAWKIKAGNKEWDYILK